MKLPDIIHRVTSEVAWDLAIRSSKTTKPETLGYIRNLWVAAAECEAKSALAEAREEFTETTDSVARDIFRRAGQNRSASSVSDTAVLFRDRSAIFFEEMKDGRGGYVIEMTIKWMT